jgi:PilZ domain
MTHFPQPHPQRRAMRIQLSNSIPTVVMLEDGQRAKAKLQAVSVTGGLLQLRQALEEGDFVEVTFPTQSGPVHGMAEMLHPTRRLSDGILQPFRFVAMEDDDHRNLRLAVDTTADRNFLGISSRWSVPRAH